MDSGGSIVHAEPSHGASQVRLDRLCGQAELAGDLEVAGTVCDQAEDLDLARRQSRDISWCGGGNATKVAMDLAESGSKGRVRGSCDDRREVLERSC